MFGGRMVSRADLAKWPLIGLAGRRLGTVFVDRSDIKSGAITIRAMRQLLAGGETVTIFPEGTTFAGDEVRPFHAGGFVAASGTDADVIPVGLAYSRRSEAAFGDETFVEHLGRMSAAPPSFVVASIGAPLELPPKTRAAAAAELAREAVAREVARARAEADRRDN
jgi:1-acyl-sn-glycerol-3-phosphate acyltransferase